MGKREHQLLKDNAGSGRIAGLTERMRRISIASLAVLMFIEVLLAGCASSRTASTDARVDPAFAAWNRPDSPGCGVGVSRNGAVIYERGYGMASLEHKVPSSTAEGVD